jgi:hypothetical protein
MTNLQFSKWSWISRTCKCVLFLKKIIIIFLCTSTTKPKTLQHEDFHHDAQDWYVALPQWDYVQHTTTCVRTYPSWWTVEYRVKSKERSTKNKPEAFRAGKMGTRLSFFYSSLQLLEIACNKREFMLCSELCSSTRDEWIPNNNSK